MSKHHTIPLAGIEGIKHNWKADLMAGFTVSLIALPLCLGIAMASGVPPFAGIIAGIVGGMLLSFITGSHLTINGPAAGLAVIVLMCMDGFKKIAPAGLSSEQIELFAYQCTLGVGVACGVLQLLFGWVKAGILSNFFPSSVVHGMLAAIGIMIIGKQIHTALGVKPEHKEVLEIIMEIPNSIVHLNPEVTIIALISLLVLIVLPLIKNKYASKLPAPMLVILIAIPLGHFFDLEHEHSYLFLDGHQYSIGPKFLVTLPQNALEGIVFPRFDYLFTSHGLQMIISFALVASLESLLTAAAVDRLDPYKRETNYNKELFAKGTGNIVSSLIGGLPIIAEVVRSSANINNGARTQWSNFFHGTFLLLFVLVIGPVIHQIPLSALAAMLIYTGYRLASPKEFIKTYHRGKEQLLIIVATIIVTLVTDLLIGIAAGVLVKLIIHMINGVSIKNLFIPFMTINVEDDTYTIDVKHSAIFSNYIALKRQLDKLPKGKHIIIDFTNAKVVGHTVVEHLHELTKKYKQTGGEMKIIGLKK